MKYSTSSTPCREYQVAIGLDIRHTVHDSNSKQENNGSEQTECLLHFLASSFLFLILVCCRDNNNLY